MAAGGHDRMSELPDDLIRRILHFAPLKEAASTTALSRRWRVPLLLSSSAIYLETGFDNHARFFYRYDDIVTAAAGALNAADARVTRLTLRHSKVSAVSRYGYTDLVDAVLSNQGARHVEELQLVARNPRDYYHYCSTKGLYEVTLDSLPLETLRVLELTNCRGITYQRQRDHAVLPRLSSLRLSYSHQHLGSLQRIIDDAPALAAVRLESVIIDATKEKGEEPTTRRLRCPAASVLVLDSCTWQENQEWRSYSGDYYKKNVDVDEIFAPRLRRFTYKGALCSFTFSPRPLELEQVNLHLFGYGGKDSDLETFWRFTRSFTSTREMILTLSSIQDIAVLSEARRVELLPAFRRLKRLEVQGVHWTNRTTETVMTILNLLRCCPALCALRINLRTREENTSNYIKKEVRTRVPQGSGLQISAMLGPGHFYKCLQSSLRGVGLQFRLERSDCLGDKLIKFFADKAMVLEEMRIDSGDKKLCEQMNPKIEKWNANRRKLGATSFVFLPLKSRHYQEPEI